MQLTQSSIGVGWANGYCPIVIVTNTFCLAGLRARRKPPDTISRVSFFFFVFLSRILGFRVLTYLNPLISWGRWSQSRQLMRAAKRQFVSISDEGTTFLPWCPWWGTIVFWGKSRAPGFGAPWFAGQGTRAPRFAGGGHQGTRVCWGRAPGHQTCQRHQGLPVRAQRLGGLWK